MWRETNTHELSYSLTPPEKGKKINRGKKKRREKNLIHQWCMGTITKKNDTWVLAWYFYWIFTKMGNQIHLISAKSLVMCQWLSLTLLLVQESQEIVEVGSSSPLSSNQWIIHRYQQTYLRLRNGALLRLQVISWPTSIW